MAKKTILIDENIHIRMKNLNVPISSFVEEAILYALSLHKKGYRIIDGTLYQAAGGEERLSTLNSENMDIKKETAAIKEDNVQTSTQIKNDDEFMS